MDVVAFAGRHPKPGETVLGTRLGFFPGGKGANQAVAAAKLGADVRMVGRIGEDSFGDTLTEFLKQQGVDLRHVRRTAEQPSGTALIMVTETGENAIVVVAGANGLLTPEDLDDMDVQAGDLLLCELEIPLRTAEAFIQRGRDCGAVTVLNAAPAQKCGFLSLPDVLVVNETELAFFLGEDLAADDRESLLRAAERLRGGPEQSVIVTLGAEGALAVLPGGAVTVPGREVEVKDTTGAGDCFVGALAARLVAQDPMERAMEYANASASVCVQRPGAGPSLPTAEEVARVLAAGEEA